MAMARRESSSRESGISADKWLKSRKGTKSPDNRKYSFLDTSSEDDSFSASHFIKKSANKEVIKAEKDAKPKKPFIKPEAETRPSTSRGDMNKPTSSMSRFSDANTRIKMLEERIRSRQKSAFNVMSSSDKDLDVSSDSEIKRDVQQIRRERKASIDSGYRKKFSYLETSSEDESTRLKFLKQDDNNETDLDSIIRPSTPSKKKSVSFASNLVHSSSSPLEVSLDEFLPSQHSDLESNSLDDFLPMSKLQQVMSLDDLMQADVADNKSSRFSPDILELQSVDELIPSYKDDNFTDESTTTTSSSPNNFGSNVFNVYSIDELDTAIPEDNHKIPEKKENKDVAKPFVNNLTSVFKSSPVKSSFKPKQDQANEPSEVDEYSSDFQSEDTLKETESIAEDITEEIKSESEIASSIHTDESYSKSTKTNSDSYTETFESATSVSSVTPAPKVQKAEKTTPKQSEIAVQTESVKIESETAYSRLNQTFFKPSSLVSNETLAMLTTFSPAVLAVQDILKQQYIHTREFIERSEKLHQSATKSLVADYQYSSLEEAREIINKQREKLNLPPRTWTFY